LDAITGLPRIPVVKPDAEMVFTKGTADRREKSNGLLHDQAVYAAS
jgi:hypothetical protein